MQETAKKNGGARKEKPKRRTGTVVRRDGREPLGLGSAITMMMTKRGMAAPAASSSVLAQFDAILAAAAPELTGHIQTVAFDADTGRLDVAPEAPPVRHDAVLECGEADRRGQHDGAQGARAHPERPAALPREGRPRHGGRHTGPAADRARCACCSHGQTCGVSFFVSRTGPSIWSSLPARSTRFRNRVRSGWRRSPSPPPQGGTRWTAKP